MLTSSLATSFSKLFLAQEQAPGSEQLSDTAGSLFFFIFCCFFFFVVIGNIVTIVSMYKVFEKAGQPGWLAIVPYLNTVVVAHIAGRDWWWGIVPILNLVPIFELAKKFGKSDGFGVGLILLPIVFFPMLGFGNARLTEPPREPLF